MVRKWDHEQLSTYGVGAETSADGWRSIVRQLVHQGLLRQDIADYSKLKLTEESAAVLRGERAVTLARWRTRPEGGRGKKAAKKRAAMLPGDVDEALFERLRDLRRTLAAEQGVPAYVVFADAALIDMAAKQPRTEADFLDVHGVGAAKAERYAGAFLGEIAAWAEERESGAA
jgi:ATP-dependent DNA helicase RecQ